MQQGKLPRAQKTEVKPLTDEQINEFMKLIDGDEFYGPLLKLILFTGPRISEAIGLTWDCINFKAGTIRIEKQLQDAQRKTEALHSIRQRVISPGR